MFKNLILFIFIFLIFTANSFTQNLEKLCEINFSNPQLFKDVDFVSLKFYSKKKKFIKEAQGIELYKIIEKQICAFKKDEISQLIFIAIAKSGQKIQFAYSDILQNISTIPAFVAFKEKIVLKDTVTISKMNGVKLSQSQKDMLSKIYTFVKVYKIYLQLNDLSQEEIQKIFKNYFLIFPQDNSTNRWVGDLEKIEIYKIKKEN
jgi:hypothetical protein